MGILDDEDDEEKKGSGVQLPVAMWERLDALAKRRGKSRNWVIAKLLKYALHAYEVTESEEAARLGKKK